jgi:PadR family transcriptional regulator, regulatory protein PadR
MEPSSPIKRLKRLLTSGNLWLYLLSVINREGRLYAYNLDELVKKQFSFRPDRIMVYVVLYRLEAEGLISSEFHERRKYYSLTAKGKEALSAARTYFRMLARRL